MSTSTTAASPRWTTTSSSWSPAAENAESAQSSLGLSGKTAPTRGGSVGGVVRRADLRGDPAALGDLEAVAARPVPDLLGARAVGGRRGLAPAAARGGADLAAVPDVRRQGVAQLGGVVVVEVDLVRRAVETEGDGLGGLAAIEVVLENNVDLLCHEMSSDWPPCELSRSYLHC